jgi:hypothetical protein
VHRVAVRRVATARVPRRGPCFVAVLALLSVLILAAAPVLAAETPTLTDEVTDETGALAGQEDRVQAALEGVRDRDGVQLFALFTGTTGGQAVTDFADDVAAANALGGNDALLVVALTDRSYALWASDALADVTDAEIDRVLVDDVEPRLIAGQYADAVIAAAEGLGEAAATPAGEEPAADRGGGVPWLALLAILAGVALLGTVAAGRVRDRRDARRAAQERDRRTRGLARDANARLLASDEAVREAEQELGFAEARFRAADVQPFRDALTQARDELHAAFAVRQRLDDDVPETPDERETLLGEIIQRTERVDVLLTTEHARLDALGDLERHADDVLAELRGQLEKAEDRLDRGDGLLERLRKIAPGHAGSVDGNLTEARKTVVAAREAMGAARDALDRDEAPTAANHLRDAQESLAHATQLVAAVEHLAEAAADAERDLGAQLRAASANVDAAAAAVGDGDAQDLDARLAEARTLLEQGRRAAASRNPDVLEAYGLAAGADAAADEVLAGARKAERRRARERDAAAKTLRAAEAAHRRAADYIAPRRRGIGPTARTRLQEAERHLDRARSLVDDDPPRTVDEARAAERLAGEAHRLARDDFDGYDRHQGPFGRGPHGGGWGRRGPTIVIGGFPIPIGGSPRGGGGWAGSTWGSPGGGRTRGGGFGGGRTRGGGFGGGRTRGGGFGGGRTRGGGFGGGRARGGRF